MGQGAFTGLGWSFLSLSREPGRRLAFVSLQSRQGVRGGLNECVTMKDLLADVVLTQPLGARSTAVMEAAFDTAWNSLCLFGEQLSPAAAEAARDRMAKAICQSFRDGERDPLKLHDAAMCSIAPLHPGA